MIGPLVGAGVALFRAAKNLKEKSDERQYQEKYQASYEASKLDARTVVRNITQAWRLKEQGILTEIEFQKEKKKALHDITVKPVAQSVHDFLLELTPLLEKGILSPEEMQQIKRCLETKFA